SQKLPQRLLNPIRERLAAGAAIDHLALAVAGWMRYVRGIDDTGATIDVRDPLASRFRAVAAEAGSDPDAHARGLLAIRAIFGEDLTVDRRFVDPVLGGNRALATDGVRRTLDRSFG